jgi:hypothetical protein
MAKVRVRSLRNLAREIKDTNLCGAISGQLNGTLHVVGICINGIGKVQVLPIRLTQTPTRGSVCHGQGPRPLVAQHRH